MSMIPTDKTIEWFRNKWIGDHEEMLADLRALITAMRSVAQEPVADDDAEWLREWSRRVGIDSRTFERFNAIADRLQAKAPETGEE